MRAALSLLSIGCCVTLLCSCAGQTRSVHYSPPSAAPVRDKISSAQSHAKAAKAALDPKTLDLKIARAEIDALTAELLDTQTALKDYELKVSDQTNAANRAIDEKNAAITERDHQAAKVRSIAKREHFFFLLLSGALIWIFRIPLLGLAKLLIGGI